jgi:hypothetical protein
MKSEPNPQPIAEPNQFRYSPEEFSQKGKKIYQDLLPHLSQDPSNHRKIIAIDIETGAYAIADTTIAAADQIFASSPEAQLWFERIGTDSVYKFTNIYPDN